MKDFLDGKGFGVIDLIEESLPGRTTAFPDPLDGPELNGEFYLYPTLLSHSPLPSFRQKSDLTFCRVVLIIPALFGSLKLHPHPSSMFHEFLMPASKFARPIS